MDNWSYNYLTYRGYSITPFISVFLGGPPCGLLPSIFLHVDLRVTLDVLVKVPGPYDPNDDTEDKNFKFLRQKTLRIQTPPDFS